jgi:hypothetical protein
MYHKSNGMWTRIGGGGGAYSAGDLIKMGFPAADACKFPVVGCPRK